MPPTASGTIQKTNSDCTESSPNMVQSSDIDKADPPASVEPSSSADNMGTRQPSLPDTDQQSIERQIARKQLEIEILEMQLEPARQQQLKGLAQTQRKKRKWEQHLASADDEEKPQLFDELEDIIKQLEYLSKSTLNRSKWYKDTYAVLKKLHESDQNQVPFHTFTEREIAALDILSNSMKADKNAVYRLNTTEVAIMHERISRMLTKTAIEKKTNRSRLEEVYGRAGGRLKG
ncbi:hypothetical protein GTA08_BOTSDO02374 [Botryosphaeria dothidea]|uniref:Uncharacterized protein n=1 Tax=Botryosphaeria dothidea TaxID=55169 RepID=A0A8H4IZA7_9PEZI|nr:hypothetical protein GTA08_BOTSDO02374 [Botryosphaeria dothidea]